MDFATANGLRLKGEVRGNLLASVVDNGCLTGFFEAWIPYEKDA